MPPPSLAFCGKARASQLGMGAIVASTSPTSEARGRPPANLTPIEVDPGVRAVWDRSADY
jgi:hypothetical protein